jgi:hypothetical protein
MLGGMADMTQILAAIDAGDPHAAADLLPLVYDELRKLAAQRLAQERPGQTLQATALVHEAYLRLVGEEKGPGWDSRGHFFAAAAEAMRRILVEAARRRGARKRGADLERIDLPELAEPPGATRSTSWLSTRPWAGSRPCTRRRPRSSSSGSSPAAPWRRRLGPLTSREPRPSATGWRPGPGCSGSSTGT